MQIPKYCLVHTFPIKNLQNAKCCSYLQSEILSNFAAINFFFFFCLASTADLPSPGKVCSPGQTLIAGNIFEQEDQHLIIFNSSLRLSFWVFFLQKCGQ